MYSSMKSTSVQSVKLLNIYKRTSGHFPAIYGYNKQNFFGHVCGDKAHFFRPNPDVFIHDEVIHVPEPNQRISIKL